VAGAGGGQRVRQVQAEVGGHGGISQRARQVQVEGSGQWAR